MFRLAGFARATRLVGSSHPQGGADEFGSLEWILRACRSGDYIDAENARCDKCAKPNDYGTKDPLDPPLPPSRVALLSSCVLHIHGDRKKGDRSGVVVDDWRFRC